MARILVLIAAVICAVAGQNVPEECLSKLSDTKAIFGVLPGMGWDNIRNVEEYQVIDISYSQCQTTPDRKFLVPDAFTVEPVLASEIEIFAETFDSAQSYSSCTSASINKEFSDCETGAWGMEKKYVSGSFAADTSFAIQKQLELNCSINRVSASFGLYNAKLKPDAHLTPAFRKRLQKIAALIDTNQDAMAKYESELLVKDFGTDVVSSVLVGGKLVKEDYFKRISTSSSESSSSDAQMRKQAGCSFNAFFFGKDSQRGSLGLNVSTSQSEAEEYVKSVHYSRLAAYGGPIFKAAGFNINDWETGLESNLAAIDRSGVPLSTFINPFVLPEVSTETVYKVETMATEAMNSYYKHNTIYGCTDPRANNFNSEANVDDGTCGVVSNTYLFGGAYQTCEETDGQFCNRIEFKNPRTNDFSCAAGYDSVLLWKASKSYSALCRTFPSLKCLKYNKQYEEVQYSVYWCAPQQQTSQTPSPGYLFGGMWNPSYQTNPATRGDYCPRGFKQVTLGVDFKLCFGEDIDNDRALALPFGGFYSSAMGNPLADKKGVSLAGCSSDFTKYLAGVDEEVDVYYCSLAKPSKHNQRRQAARPPFMKLPLANEYALTQATIKMSDMQAASLKLRVMENVVANLTALEKEDVKQDSAALKSLERTLGLKSTNDDSGSNSISTTTIVVLTATTTMMVMIVLVLLIVRFRKRKQASTEYTPLSNPGM